MYEVSRIVFKTRSSDLTDEQRSNLFQGYLLPRIQFVRMPSVRRTVACTFTLFNACFRNRYPERHQGRAASLRVVTNSSYVQDAINTVTFKFPFRFDIFESPGFSSGSEFCTFVELACSLILRAMTEPWIVTACSSVSGSCVRFVQRSCISTVCCVCC